MTLTHCPSITHRHCRPGLTAVRDALVAILVLLLPVIAQAQEEPVEIHGGAILAHPVGKAFVAAAELLYAGRLADLRATSAAEVREEWASLSPAEQAAETERLRGRAPEPRGFATDVERIGEMTIYGDSATLRLPTADGEGVTAIAFAVLEEGEWKVTGGPMTIAPPLEETEPRLVGAEILEHEIGKLALAYAQRLEGGDLEGALVLLSQEARSVRDALPPEERAASDDFRRNHLPGAAALATQIRDGGEVVFAGDSAFLNVVSHLSAENPDGSTTFTSTSLSLPFARQGEEWRIGD